MPDSDLPLNTKARVVQFLFEYGNFLAFWSTFDIIVEVLIMRELGVDAERLGRLHRQGQSASESSLCFRTPISLATQNTLKLTR